MSSAEQRLTAVLTAPMAEIVDEEVQVSPDPSAVQVWDLPERDREALVAWGLPADGLLTPDFQPAPMLVPNVAGPQERRWISPDERLYRLGGWGSHELTPWMGAVAGDGRVLAIRQKPMTAEDVHPALREHYRDLYHPAVDFINSSVAQLVEIAWRWRAANAVLVEIKETGATIKPDDVDAHFDRIEAAERIVLAGFETIDGHVRADDPSSLWRQVVTDPGC